MAAAKRSAIMQKTLPPEEASDYDPLLDGLPTAPASASRAAVPPITRLDFFSLKLFADVVELRNMTKAAERNYLAASAASKRISDLEEMFSTQLLYRLARGVEPTPAGYVLYRHAQSTLGGLRQLNAELSEYAQGVRGQIRVFASLAAVIQFLPDDLAKFRESHPDVRVDLQEQSTSDTLESVTSGLADIGIVSPVVEYPNALQFWHYRATRLVLVTPAVHPLAKRKSIKFFEALEHEFVSLTNGGGWDRLVTQAANAYNQIVRTRVRVGSYDAACHMVRAKLGISIVPGEIAAGYSKSLGIKMIRLDEPWAELSLDMCVRDYKTLAVPARLFIDHLLGRKPGG